MIKYTIRAEYIDHVTHEAEIVVEANSEAEALRIVRQMDHGGELDFHETDMQSDEAEYWVAYQPSPSLGERAALDAMVAAYLGEG